MFWKFDLNTTSHVDKLLDKEHVTLQELMDEDDILQECKAQNQKLLDFLCRQQCMEELVNLITQDPPQDMEEKVRFKYPNTACELLTCDVPQISDRLGEDESLLNLLYDFLDQEPPLNPLLASFFSKTIGNLIARKTEQVIMFLKKKEKFISQLLKHIGTSALMDLLLRLVSCVEPVGLRQEVLHWLNEEKIIQRIVALIHPHQDEDRQSNASQALCDIIRLGRDQGSQLQETVEPDPLLITLESQDCVEQLLKNMFDGDQTESCLVSGMQVLLALLEPRRVGTEGLVDSFSQGLERSHSVSSSILRGIEPWLKNFHQLLLNPPKKKAILTTIGVLEEPLGNARLHGARLMAALLHTNTPGINQELCRLNTMDLLLDLFFKYTWNNFLHLQVELCIAAILSHAAREEQAEASGSDGKVEPLQGSGDGNGKLETTPSITSPPENTMVTHLFQKCCLVQRILEAWEANDHTQAAGGMRRGNMGHLTRIANAVVQNLEQGPVQAHISEVIRGLPADCRGRWESFVEETLMETNRRNTVDLAFSEYQIQQMTANFVDQFGFNDEEFADQDDNINAPFDRIAEINFNIEADEDSPSAALFEACCSDRIQPFDDDEEEDIWEDDETRCAARVMARARFGAPHVSDNYSKNALEHGGQDRKTGSAVARNVPGLAAPSSPTQKEGPRSESDSAGTTWTAVFDEPVNPLSATPGAARDVGSSAWAAGPSVVEEKGWAKFTDFQPFCCSETGPRCSSPVDMDHSNAEGGQSPGPEKTFGPTSPCAWNVCVTRKAPLVASDSSSSGGSDSEDDEKAAGAVEAVCTGHTGKVSPPPRTAEAAVGRAECPDSTVLAPACPAPSEVTISPAVATIAPSKAGSPTATIVVSSSVAAAVPPGPIVAVTTAAPAIVATLGTMTKDRKADALPEGAALNGPV
ncbi:serine/threonine-protein phosphatase 6 regulatory subunit 2 isoform X10 [Mus musculus]|uniref:Protein phosphatase 6, regulatory subunit 2 n=2 Tax=Mus musculus TaxID=10090 RepID=G3X9K4_MOUSE|nr:serine/threonine-protein phosphatase 6 regulatory subunit 2 isoform 1 [Mus musculus]NP_081089.1 serine/threonine-protein phosphatase 6 regulatory subunit 2 isoform 1 [Mus musculus]XP_017172236.1 serine/threonine-protein phosphatase 6 regulatory subunit 2 isoform X10 [Mus musculus]EDL04361.1 SAPS domain family, member 2, isoform CRA_a [Mus musculus]EDL04362.1 SAPS domain family, member 2, isoform CRA_a [Mus musculus]|eukprot:NP_081089.1 serine/threonine-protein phosphatase 6 regulatory subunit 2 isoform 1 [Mus musculus]